MNTIEKLAPNQMYFFSESKIIFQSYDTIIATIENYEKGNNPVVTITDDRDTTNISIGCKTKTIEDWKLFF